MISENALKRSCTPATFARARQVAADGSRLHRRRFGRDDASVSLGANIDSSDSWEDAHRTSALLDEATGALVEYSCDCVDAVRRPGPCKHVIGLVLDYLARPEEYDGYEAGERIVTSRVVRRLLDRAAEAQAGADRSGELAEEATVSIDLQLSYDVGFDARFRLRGPQGAYAMASITDFATRMEERSSFRYGKYLAFAHVPEAFDPRARAVADLLVRAVQNRRAYSFERVTGRGAFGAPALPARTLHLSAPELHELMACYAGTDVQFDHAGAVDEDAPHPVRVVTGDPQVRLALAEAGDGAFSLFLSERLRATKCGGRLYAWDHECFYACTDRLSQHADLLSAMLGSGEDELLVAADDMPAFCATVLPELERVATVRAPSRVDELRPAPCELHFYLDRVRDAVTCLAFATYGDQRIELGRSPGAGKDKPGVLVRDLPTEARARELCRRLFPDVASDGAMASHVRGEALARLAYEGVAQLQRLGTVYTTASLDALRSKARPHVQVGLSVRSNLLDVSFSVTGVDEAELAGLLESYRLRRRYHRLADGSFLDLAQAQLEQAADVADELGLTSAQLEHGVVTLPAYRALPLDPLVAADDRDRSLEEYLDRMRSVRLESYVVPADLADVLRPYQVDGFRWLSGLVDLGLGGILADEMGLGKTVQLIALLLARRDEAAAVGPTLIVCPASLVYNWLAELEKFAPRLAVQAVGGTAEERRACLERSGADVLVTSYDLLRRDIDAYVDVPLWCTVLDEAQYVKNHETSTAQAVKRLQSQNRIALTGTPVENRLSELWSIFDFLMPGLLGDYDRFRERYERPIVEGDADASARLAAAIGPFVLRRAKADVVRDLPEKIERTVRVRMDGTQRRLYDAQVLDLRATVGGETDADFGRGKLQILAALTRLRQICCDPRLAYEDYDEGSAKTDALLTLLERLADSGQKTLVFSQFTSYLAIIAEELARRGLTCYTITGSTPKRTRVALVDRFNSDETPVFLISLKAGGTGLNLTGASAVVHADPWWNAAAQDQATDRAHRIGQTKNVTVYRLVASNTIEERMLDLQRTKAHLFDEIVGQGAAGMSLGSLTREDLEDLLR